jgi:hypothetical protein
MERENSFKSEMSKITQLKEERRQRDNSRKVERLILQNAANQRSPDPIE